MQKAPQIDLQAHGAHWTVRMTPKVAQDISCPPSGELNRFISRAHWNQRLGSSKYILLKYNELRAEGLPLTKNQSHTRVQGLRFEKRWVLGALVILGGTFLPAQHQINPRKKQLQLGPREFADAFGQQ